jgi:hypothetical protein
MKNEDKKLLLRGTQILDEMMILFALYTKDDYQVVRDAISFMKLIHDQYPGHPMTATWEHIFNDPDYIRQRRNSAQ